MCGFERLWLRRWGTCWTQAPMPWPSWASRTLLPNVVEPPPNIPGYKLAPQNHWTELSSKCHIGVIGVPQTWIFSVLGKTGGGAGLLSWIFLSQWYGLRSQWATQGQQHCPQSAQPSQELASWWHLNITFHSLQSTLMPMLDKSNLPKSLRGL